jgi:hypothetical protein
MNLRVEFFKSRSDYFNLAVDLCRKQLSYKEVATPAGVKHCIEFDSFNEEFKQIFRFCSCWKGAFFHIDDKPMKSHKIWRLMWDAEKKEKEHFGFKFKMVFNPAREEISIHRIMSGDEILQEIKESIKKKK